MVDPQIEVAAGVLDRMAARIEEVSGLVSSR
jgi:hypothetical protein